MSKTEQLRVSEYLRHIIEAIERIDRYTKNMTEVQFLDDEKTQDATGSKGDGSTKAPDRKEGHPSTDELERETVACDAAYDFDFSHFRPQSSLLPFLG